MSKLVVFDIDGTLLNSFSFFKREAFKYSNENNLPMPSMDLMKKGYANPDDYDFGWNVNKYEQRKHLENIFDIVEKESMNYIPELFEGVEDTLVHLKDTGHTLGIVTSKTQAPLIEMLEYHNIYTLFSGHRTWCDIKNRGEKEKPSPDMLNSLMKELNFISAETIMIGDTNMDIGMGRNANTNTIGVTWGAHPKEFLIDAGAHHIVETKVSDIVPVIIDIN